MRISWRNLDWVSAEQRASTESRLEALGGHPGGIARVDFVASEDPAGQGSHEIRVLGKVGTSQITAIRTGTSAEQAFELSLAAFEESALYVLDSAAGAASGAAVEASTVEGGAPESEANVARWRASPEAEPLEIESSAEPVSGRPRSRRERLEAFRARTRWQLRVLITLPTLRVPLRPIPTLKLPDLSGFRVPSLPRVRLPQIQLPAFPQQRISSHATVRRAAALSSSSLHVMRSEWRRWSLTLGRLGSVCMRDLGDVFGPAFDGIRNRGLPVAAAAAGFLIIGISSFEGESFTGRTLPPETRLDRAAFTATANLLRTAEPRESAYWSVARAPAPGALTLGVSAPGLPSEEPAFSAVATPSLRPSDPASSDDEAPAGPVAFQATAAFRWAWLSPGVRALRPNPVAYGAVASDASFDFAEFVAFSNEAR